jgi:GNAT superfamily N-acetyltransferase
MQHAQTIGGIFASAFKHYPLMKYAFEGCTEQQKAKGLLALYTHCTKAAQLYGGILTSDDNHAAIIWLPSKHYQLGLMREVASGMWQIPFKLGPKATLRLMNHDAEPEGWIRKHASDKMGYIWVVGVLADARGKGYSRMLIEQAISDMKQHGLTEFWLKTEDPKNVQIYQKLDFEVVQEMTVKSSGLKSWVMKRT